MDIEMKNADGIEATRAIKKKYPNIDIIVLTMHSEEEYMIDAIRAGAKGYILKNSSCSSILNAIKSVMRGEPALDSASSTKDALKNIIELLHYKDTGKEAILSRKELEVLKLISEGCTNKAISEGLHISIHTARNHVANIFSKLNCSNRTKAVKEGQRRRLI
ncbi:MAG TPA: DNA-binding response regulator [Rikenellaceae bacterium]|nr:DNA-binding response regulator [Rikenellaceae bacterium]